MWPEISLNSDNLIRLFVWLAAIYLSISYFSSDYLHLSVHRYFLVCLFAMLTYFIAHLQLQLSDNWCSKYLFLGLSITTALTSWEIYNTLDINLGLGISHLSDLNRVIIALVFLFWPCAYSISRDYKFGYWMVLVLWVAIGALCLFGGSQSALIAFAVSSIAYLILRTFKYAILLIAIIAVAGTILTPLIVRYIGSILEYMPKYIRVSGNADHRLAILKYYEKLIDDKFLFGYGFESVRAIGSSEDFLRNLTNAGFPYNTGHPHNFSLELWVSFGAVGIFIYCMLIFLLCTRKATYNTHIMLCLLSAILTAASTAYGLFETWWYCTMIIAFLAVASQKNNNSNNRNNNYVNS